MKKRIFSLLLAALLCLSYVPGVFASEEVQSGEPAEEILASLTEGGGTAQAVTEGVDAAAAAEEELPQSAADAAASPRSNELAPGADLAEICGASPLEERALEDEPDLSAFAADEGNGSAADAAEDAGPLSEGGGSVDCADGGSEPAEAAEPVEEASPDEGASEEPEQTEASPALDGAPVTLYSSKLADKSDLKLTSDTTLIVDEWREIRSVSGNYTLDVQGDKTLVVHNTGGHGITASSLKSSAHLIVIASGIGLNIDGDINVTGGTLTVIAGGDGVYSPNGSIALNCTADIKSTGGRAIYALRKSITLGGNLTASTTDGDSDCIESGGTFKNYIYSGHITFNEGTFTVTAKRSAVHTFYGDIDIHGRLTATSGEGVAILSNRITGFSNGDLRGTITIDGGTVEAEGKTIGIRSGGNIIIMNAEITASGSNRAISAEDGFTMDSRLAVLTPGISRFKDDTIVNSYGDPAMNIVIGLRRITGKAQMTYPDDKVYVGDTVRLVLTDVPSSHKIQWERSEDGWSNFTDIAGETGETYTVRPEDRGYKIQARITAEGYSGELTPGGAFVFVRTITAAAIDLAPPVGGEAIPSAADGKPVEGSGFTIGEQFWCDSMSVSWGKLTSGTFTAGTTYYYYAELIPKENWEFAGPANRLEPEVLSVKANGVEASSGAKSESGRVTVYIPFKAEGKEYTGDIRLTGFVPPVAGGTVSSSVKAGNSAFEITDQGWSDSIPVLFTTKTKDVTFQGGKAYYWICTVKLTGGRIFPEGYEGPVTLDGKAVPYLSSADKLLAVMKKETPEGGWDTINTTMTIAIRYVAAGSSAKRGDYDQNGVVDVRDHVYLSRALKGVEKYTRPEEMDLAYADLNGDGKVNRLDRIYLSRALRGMSGYTL